MPLVEGLSLLLLLLSNSFLELHLLPLPTSNNTANTTQRPNTHTCQLQSLHTLGSHTPEHVRQHSSICNGC